MGNRPNVCKHNRPKIHKGQHQQGRRGIWKGFTHLVSKKIDTIFAKRLEKLLLQAKDNLLWLAHFWMLWTQLVEQGWCSMVWGTHGDGVGKEDPPTAAPSAFTSWNSEPSWPWNLTLGTVSFGQLCSKSGIPSFLKMWQRKEFSSCWTAGNDFSHSSELGVQPSTSATKLVLFSLWVPKNEEVTGV